MGLINKLLSSLFGNKGNKESSKNNMNTNSKMENYNEYMSYISSTTYPDNFVVFDFETTGLDANDEKIIQIGAIRYRNNEKIEVFNTYVNPKKAITERITEITGIRNRDVRNAPTIERVFSGFLDFIGNDVIIAHNADFDMKFLLNNAYKLRLNKPTNNVIDTLSLSRRYIKNVNGSKLSNYKLETLKNNLNIKVGSHNSLDDCLVCAEVYKRCKENMIISQKITREIKAKEPLIIDNELLNKEMQCFDNVKKILLKNNRNIEFLKSSHTGNYYDIVTFYMLVRIKLKGKKQYILSRYKEVEIKDVWADAVCEPATKSEIGKIRIEFESPDDLFKLEHLILKDFDSNMESIEIYKTNVGCGEKNVQEYLNTI